MRTTTKTSSSSSSSSSTTTQRGLTGAAKRAQLDGDWAGAACLWAQRAAECAPAVAREYLGRSQRAAARALAIDYTLGTVVGAVIS